MVSFIILFLPAVLMVWIYEGLTRHRLALRQWACFYGVCVLMLNTIAMMIMRLLLNWPGENLSDVNVYMATNYLVLTVPFAVLLGVLTALISRNLKIEFEEKKDGEE